MPSRPLRRGFAALLLASALVPLGALVPSCANVIGLDSVDRVPCALDCGLEIDEGAPDVTRDGPAKKPDSGRPDGGRAEAGHSEGGHPDGGKPDGGQPDEGNPDTGNPDGGKKDSPTTTFYTIGGTVSGLAGKGLVLQDEGSDDLTIASNGAFVFATAIATGKPYSVTVLTEPSSPSQVCDITSGSGTVAAVDVTNVTVTCTTLYTIGGTVSGLLSGASVVLQDNGKDNLTVSTNGSFTFATPIASGVAYSATVLTEPTTPPETCMVTAGSGTVGSADVIGIVVSCSAPPTDVSFPTTTSTCAGQSPGPLGTGGTTGFRWLAADSVSQAYARPAPSVELVLDFSMSDSTGGCGTGVTLDWNVELNGTVVGAFSWVAGSATTHTVSQTYTYTAIAPLAGEFTIDVVATSSVCSGGGSWDWIPGGTAAIE